MEGMYEDKALNKDEFHLRKIKLRNLDLPSAIQGFFLVIVYFNCLSRYFRLYIPSNGHRSRYCLLF